MNQLKYQLRYALPLCLIGLFTNWMPENAYVLKLRGILATPFIKQCGRNFRMGSHVILLNTDRLVVGDNVYIAHGTWLNCFGGLTIEDEVMLAPYVVISTMQHVFKNGSARFGGSTMAPITIGRGSWLAAHVSVKSGVTIGKGNLIAANATVVKDTPDNVIMGGVPAKVIKEVEEEVPDIIGRARG